MKKAIYLLLVSVLFVTACTEQAPRIAKYTDLYAVKGTDSLFLDRYTAVSVEQDDARPCLVFVFGGGFIAGERDAERYLPFFHYMVNQGYDVVSIDYRLGLKQVVASGDLSPENMMLGMARTISMAVEDLYDATAFIVDKADEWVSTPLRSWPVGRVRERSPCCMANTPSATLRRWCNTCLSASATRVSFLSPGRSSKWARSSFGHRSPRR